MFSLAQTALRHRKIVGFLLLLLLVGGVKSFYSLGKKEDSVFVIKSAALSCHYPGATPFEVEELITEPIEREIQSMRSIHKITSESRYGISRIRVELDPGTPPDEIPQLWNELRRRVLNIEPRLPEGASAIQVSDDFGDVYGLYYALTADNGYSAAELRHQAQLLKTRLLAIEGVQKVALHGEQEPVINLYISLSALAGFSVRPEAIIATIRQQNTLLGSGRKEAGELEIILRENGTYRSIEDLKNQLLFAADGKQFRLGDIARIERGSREPASSIMQVDGNPAIGIGISTDPRADVVKVGRRLKAELSAFDLPVGLDLVALYPEDQIAREATDTFLWNLAESLLIVVAIIMVVMGLREGVLIGSSLLFSIGGTLLLMQGVDEGLNRTSLAGFIIAMGMLVDNAIVVVDNARTLQRQGLPLGQALIRGAEEPKWSLLGATLIGILSFLPLYLAPSSVAEIIRPLFVVVSLSLLLSWLLALTQTPLFGQTVLRGKLPKERSTNPAMRLFEHTLEGLLHHRVAALTAVVLLFGVSLWQMGRMPQNFFPSLDKPYFRADVLLPEGYDIGTTERALEQMSEWLKNQPEVRRVSFTAGGTPPRYYLASSSVAGQSNFGNLLIELHDSRMTASVEERFADYVEGHLPDVWLRSSLFKLSPVPDAAIEFGFIGPDADTLQRLTDAAEAILWRDGEATNIRQSWGNRIAVWEPRYSQMKAQRIGISRNEVARSLTLATSGLTLGEYREGDQLLPILLKDENIADYNLPNLRALPLFAPSGRVFALEQATDGFRLDFRRGVIARYNRERVMKAQSDPQRGVNTQQLFRRLYDSVRSIPLPKGYRLKPFGEQESQSESNQALAKHLPLCFILIFTILLFLFDNYRNPLILVLLLPLILIGVVWGLTLLGKLFNFFSLLGLLGLVGMNIKNGVVLLDEIERRKRNGVAPYRAMVEATRSRVVPVVIASGTTILGMIPLLFDALFGAMAATIMGGLFVATLLILFVLPLLYSLFYHIQPPQPFHVN